MPRINFDKDLVTDSKDINESFSIKKGKRIGFCRESLLLVKREILGLKRDYITLIISVFVGLFLGTLYGLIFSQSANRDADDFDFGNAAGVVSLVVISVIFGAAEGPLLTFPLERGIFLREYRTGTYSAFSYFLSKLLVEIPKAVITPATLFILSYFLLGFEGSFLVYILVGWMLALAVASYSILLGSIVTDPEKAQQFSTLVLVPQLLFSGLFASLDIIPPYLNWAQYLCVLKYALNLIFIEEFSDCDFDLDELERLPGLEENCTFFFEANEVDSDLIYRDVGILVGIFVVVRTASVFVLMLRSKQIE